MAERTYYSSWLQALGMSALPIAITMAGSVRKILQGTSNAPANDVLALGAITALLILATRLLLRVCVSPEGIRGFGRKVFRWSEMETITPSGQLTRGFYVQSKFVPTLLVGGSIAKREEFQEHVLRHVPERHPLAIYLREH